MRNTSGDLMPPYFIGKRLWNHFFNILYKAFKNAVTSNPAPHSRTVLSIVLERGVFLLDFDKVIKTPYKGAFTPKDINQIVP
ncbi:hypothetical protein COL60_14555 [Bacillus pseudomycoides]|nr:hypothetical protein COL60_14555 [Bacillus pseudomycoides]